MSTTTTNRTQTSSQSGGNRGWRGGNRGGRGGKTVSPTKAKSAVPIQVSGKDAERIITGVASLGVATKDTSESDGVVCWICAEPVKYWSVPECDHRTCHICALRLRALYKKTDCVFCKEPQPSIILTVSPDATFASFTPDSIPYKDSRLSIFFETEEMMEETMCLLRFNCPETSCDYVGTGWGDLKLHIRSVHGRIICDLCIRSKKVFAHEHSLYTPAQFPLHLPSMPHNRHRTAALAKESLDGGAHPMCEFCRECFFGNDELYLHMRERHEECFICKRNEVRDQYFLNWDAVEKHFHAAHFPCTHSQCLAQKFIVFNTALDLKAHMVEEHGAQMTTREVKDTRKIQAGFEFEEPGGRGGRGSRDRGDREREREPPPQQQQLRNGPSAGNRRREGFSGSLTLDSGPNMNGPAVATPVQRRPSPSPIPEDLDPAVAARHADFNARLSSMTLGSSSAAASIKAAIRGFRSSESGARDLIMIIWNVLDHNLDQTASLVSALVDLLDDEDKKRELLASWNGFKIEQREQFPDLVPTSVGSGYAGITSGRVINAKQITATHSSQRSSRQVWDRVAQAASSSSSRFPALPPPVVPTRGPAPSSGYKQEQRNTPWSASAAAASGSGFRPAVQSSSNPPLGNRLPAPKSRQPPPALSSSSFPTLPKNSTKQKPTVSGNTSLKNIAGDNTTPNSVWGGGSGNSAAAVSGSGRSTADTPGPETQEAGAHKSKKGKGKQKQTLFTLGSFPV